MIVEFMEIDKKDPARTLGPVFVNPRHVVEVKRAATDPEKAQLLTVITTVKREVLVDGSPTEAKDKLNRAGS